MTLSSTNLHQFELLSNRSYRNFYLRQHFIDVLNISHSSLIQSMVEKHQLLTNLEEIRTRRRRRTITSSSLLTVPIRTVQPTGCLSINSNKIQSTFSWSDAIDGFSSIELVYHVNTNQISKSSIPLRIVVKQSDDLREVFALDTNLEYDSVREFYFLNIYDYLRQIKRSNLIIESILSDQTCSTSHSYLILSSFRSNHLSFHEETKCKLKSIQIQFEELGLAHLIIRPKEYTFTYCDGSCSDLTLQQGSLHTFLQAMISKKNSHVRHPTCVPSQYADDNFLLRQTNGDLQIYPVKDIIVKQCACL
ncbi:unnamed protein product [Adineta ricciae]|uniref:TGF-beta family profile domain-containing protein n=1 Tax=Adineta ricciae TaxID=249248 RepID=A0A816BPG7_ADIRI|nr:unnamed protein product [Adineta ricciae]CAF1610971.1 unnamed protein product [Adineta ricciae]